jgi:hypothetical protein
LSLSATAQDTTIEFQVFKRGIYSLSDTLSEYYYKFHFDSVLAISLRCGAYEKSKNISCSCNIDSTIERFKNISILELFDCECSEGMLRISSKITKLTHLEDLRILSKKVDSLTFPSNFGELDSLKRLKIRLYNQHIPYQFYSLKSISLLYMTFPESSMNQIIYNDIINLLSIKSLKEVALGGLKWSYWKKHKLRVLYKKNGVRLEI